MIRTLVLVVVAAAAIWLGWRWLVPDDEAQINAVLERIADGIGSGAAEGEVGRLARAASIRTALAPDVVVDAGPPFQRLQGRDAIIGAAARTSATVRNLDIRFPDVSIVVAPDRRSASAVVTAEARFDDGARRGLDARELDIAFTRLDGAWVVSGVTLVQPLRRLDGR